MQRDFPIFNKRSSYREASPVEGTRFTRPSLRQAAEYSTFSWLLGSEMKMGTFSFHSLYVAKNARGFLLIEAIVAAAVCLIVLAGIISAFSLSLRTALSNTAQVQASTLSEEGLEVVRLMRDGGWSANIASHSSGSMFYITWNGSTWVSTTTNTFINNIFERAIVLENVYRDASQNIASNGTLDANTKKAAVTVSWLSRGATTSATLSTYITNIFNN